LGAFDWMEDSYATVAKVCRKFYGASVWCVDPFTQLGAIVNILLCNISFHTSNAPTISGSRYQADRFPLIEAGIIAAFVVAS